MTKIHNNLDKNSITIVVLAGFCFVTLIATVATTLHLSSMGMELYSLEKKERVLSEENTKLVEKFVVSDSLAEIGRRAPEMGFGKGRVSLFLGGVVEPVANLQ